MAQLSPECSQNGADPPNGDVGLAPGSAQTLGGKHHIAAPVPVLEPLFSPQLKEDHQKALLRREFELQSLNLQRRLEQKFWSQEKNLLVQESQQFRQSFLLLFMKLKWFLKRWRQGKVVHSEGEDFLEVQWAAMEGRPHCWVCPSCLFALPRAVCMSPILGQGLWVPTSPQTWCHPQVNSMKELYLLLEEEELAPQQQADNKMCAGDTWTPNTVSRLPMCPGGGSGQDQPLLWLCGMGWWLLSECMAGWGCPSPAHHP